MSQSRLLWITPKWPLPSNDGARIATRALLREVTRRGLHVDLLSVVEPDERVNEEEARRELGVMTVSTAIGPKTTPLTSALRSPFTPITMRRFVGESFRTRVMEGVRRASCVVYDGLHPAAHAIHRGGVFRSPFSEVPIVYRAHNREAQIWERRAAQKSAERSLLGLAVGVGIRMQERLVRRFEDSVCRAAALVATVSGEDTVEFRKIAGVRSVETVPIGFDFSATNTLSKEKLQGLPLLFVGRLDWPPNREGLAWFLDEVWPDLLQRRPDASLTIVGSGDGGWLTEYSSFPRVRFEGRVPETAPCYEGAIAAIVPVFYGGGTRVKVIEACRHGVASIGTSVGVEGVGLSNKETFFRAETALEWVELLATVTGDALRAVGEKAFVHARKHFSEEVCGEAFVRHVNSILRRPS